MAGGAVGELFVTIGADVNPFDRGMGHVQQKMASTATDVQRHGNVITRALGGIGSAAGGVVDALGKIGLAGLGLQAVAAGVQGLGQALGVGLLGEMEDVSAQFNAFTKDADKTRAILAEVRKEADSTPFAFREMAGAAAGLMPVAKQSGMALMDLVKLAEILAASNPMEGLEGAAFSLREAMSGDFVSIVERFNLPRSYINKLKEEGLPAIEIVRRAMLEMGFDADLVANKAATLAGRWSTFNDTIDGLKMRVSQPIFDALKVGLEGMQGWLESNKEAINEWADAMAAGIQSGISGLSDLWRNGQPALTAVSNGLATVVDWVQKFFGYFQANNDFDLMRALFGPDLGPKIDNVVRAVKGIFTEFGNIWRTFQSMLSGGMSFDTWFGGATTRLQSAYGNYVGKLLEFVGAALPKIAAKLQEWANAFVNWIAPMINPLLAKANELAGKLLDWVRQQVPPLLAQLSFWGAQLVAWIAPMISPLLAEAGKLADRFLAWVGEQAPPLLAKLGEWAAAFVAWIVPMTVDFLAKWPGMLNSFLDWIAGAAGPILAQLGEWALAFVKWIVPMIPGFVQTLGAIAAAITVFVVETAAVLAVKLLEWGAAFVAWVAPQIGPLLGKLGEMLLAIGGWMLNTALPAILDRLLKWGAAFVDWVGPQIPPLLAALGDLLGSLGNWITQEAGPQVINWMTDMGRKMVDGILQGLANMKDRVSAKLGEALGGSVDYANDTLQMRSPSRVMMKMGENMIAGLTLGIGQAAQDFENHFIELLASPIRWWEQEFGTFLNYMDKRWQLWAGQQATNLDHLFEEVKYGRAGLEDFAAVLENVYGGFRKIISPLQEMVDLIAAPVVARYADELTDVTAELADQEYWYKRQIDAIDEAAELHRAAYQGTLDDINGVIDAIKERIRLEQQPFEDERLAASEEYEALQDEIHKAELDFARRREVAFKDGDAERVKAIEDEERAYKAAQRFRLDVLRAEMDVAKDQIELVADRYAAELKAQEDLRAQVKADMDAQAAHWRAEREHANDMIEADRKRAAERKATIEEEKRAALAMDGTIQRMLVDINAMQSKLAEVSMIGAITNIVQTLRSASIPLSAELLDTFSRLPRAAGGLLDQFIGLVRQSYPIPSFDRGGIVPGARGEPQLVIAHGGETVTPAGQGAGTTNNYYLTAEYRYQDERTLVDEVRWLELLGSLT